MKEIEGNKLIAEFMAATYCQYPNKVFPDMGYKFSFKINGSYWWNEKALEFHSSWDWLMPVVEKIEAYTCLEIAKTYVQINDKSCAIWTYFDVKEILRLTGDDKNEEGKFKVRYNSKSKIESTWLAVIDFIKWRNSINSLSSNKK